MSNNKLNNEGFLRDSLDVYLSKWKLICLFVVSFLLIAFVYLRYVQYEYQANATIKINDEKSKNKLPEISSLQNYGLFKSDANNVLDEIEVIKSRALISEVIKDLKFNIQFFVEGRVQEHEVYIKKPLIINFSAPDSILHKADTLLNVKIKSASDFELIGDEEEDSNIEPKVYSFGENIETTFGDIIITPNIGQYATKIGTNIKIEISPITKIIGRYRKKLQIETKENSSIIKLSINDNEKDKARFFLDKLIEKYNDDVINDKLLVVKTTSDFINNRLEIVSRELGEVDLTAESLKQSKKITDIPTQSNIFLQTERENEAKLIATENQIQLIDYMSDYLGDNNKSSDLLPANVGISDNSVDQITRQHNELVLERNRILKSSSEINPTVVNLTNQIDALKSNLSQSLSNIKSSRQITLSTLQDESSRISSQIYSAPKKEREFRDVKRQQDIKEALYLYLLQKREESAINLGVSSPNAKIVDAAYASSKPVAPRKTLIILSCFILGISIPVGLIYLHDLIDTKVHTIEDIKKIIDIPYVGDIPKSKNGKMLVSKVDYSPKAEAFRMVRTNIDFMLQNIDGEAKTIFLTSTTSKEGKSHTSFNLALSLSHSNKKVLLIETDIRVPKSSNYLGVKNDVGLTNYIGNPKLKAKDVISNIDDNENLDIITSGTIPPNPSELLMSNRFGLLFEDVKLKYDYIIVDTAAVGLVTDTLLISKYADMFIYVVRANYLDKRQLHVLKTMHNEKRLPNVAVLLNSTVKRKGYGYGYGYGNNPSAKSKEWFKKFT